MLILSRHINQGFRMYDETGRYVGRVVLLGARHGRAILGIEADERFVVLRDELVDALEAPR